MIILLKLLQPKEIITLLHLVFTVWKLFVLHVGLLKHGQSLLGQSLLPIFWHFWTLFIQKNICDLIMFVLTRLVQFFALLFSMDHGSLGGKPLGSLWMHIITLTIEQLIISVANGATLLH